jgi:hypothetical protein
LKQRAQQILKELQQLTENHREIARQKGIRYDKQPSKRDSSQNDHHSRASQKTKKSVTVNSFPTVHEPAITQPPSQERATLNEVLEQMNSVGSDHLQAPEVVELLSEISSETVS